MPPDAIHLHHEGRECQKMKSTLPHEDEKSNDAGFVRSDAVRHATPQTPIDLTSEPEDLRKVRKHNHDEPTSGSTNKRPKLSNNNDSSKTATHQTCTSPGGEIHFPEKYSTLHVFEKHRRQLEQKEQEIIAERQRHDATKAKMEDMEQNLKAKTTASADELAKLLSRTNAEQNHSQARIRGLESSLAHANRVLRAKNGEFETERQCGRRILQQLLETQQELKITQRDLNSANEGVAMSQQLLKLCGVYLQEGKKEVEEAKEKQQNAEKLAKSIDAVNENWALKFAEYHETKKKLKKNLVDTKKDFKSAQKGHDAEKGRLTAQIEELQAQFDSEQEEWNKCKGELLHQIRDLQGFSQRHNFKVPDEELIERWGTLKQNICQFVDRYTRPVSSLNGLALNSMWLAMSTQAQVLLASPISYVFAFEAYMWNWLCRVVFDDYSVVWAGDLGKSFSELSKKAYGQLRGQNDDLQAEYHSWRSKSTNMLSRLSKRSFNHESYQADIRSLMGDLAQLLGSDLFAEESAFLDLQDILNDARTFDIMRRKLQSEIQICHFSFDADDNMVRQSTSPIRAFMRDRSWSGTGAVVNKEAIVDLIISPTIIRVGNSDGVRYDQQKCLVKMDVLSHVSTDFQQRMGSQAEYTTQGEPSTTKRPKEARSQDPNNIFKDSSADHGEDGWKGIKQEQVVQSDIRDVAHSAASQTAQSAAPASANNQRDGRDNTSTRPFRTARQNAQSYCATAYQDKFKDELGDGCSDSDEGKHEDQNAGSKSAKSRKRKSRDVDDDFLPETCEN